MKLDRPNRSANEKPVSLGLRGAAARLSDVGTWIQRRYPQAMTESNILDLVLSNAIRFLIEGGLPLEIVEEDGRLRYFVEGQEFDADQIMASARLIGMMGLTPPANG